MELLIFGAGALGTAFDPVQLVFLAGLSILMKILTIPKIAAITVPALLKTVLRKPLVGLLKRGMVR